MAHEDLGRRLRTLGPHDVLTLGQLREEIVRRWTTHVSGNRDVVITGRQRDRYLHRHPEMQGWEALLADLVTDPDEVLYNRRDPLVALFYRRLDADHYLRAAVVMQPVPGPFKHSVITFRLAREDEVSRGRVRRAWRREET